MIGLAVIFSAVLLVRQLLRRNSKLPPGPAGLPLIGNLLQMPRANTPAWVKYAEWGREYGDVMHLSVLGQSIIILNSPKAIFDLFDRRGATYADRPWLTMVSELVGLGDSPMLVPSGPLHKEYRRLYAEAMGGRKEVGRFHSVQQEKAITLATRFLETPQDFRKHLTYHIASLIFEISHGHVMKGENDLLLKLAKGLDYAFADTMIPGRYLVDLFPSMKYIPAWTGVTFKKKAKEYREVVEAALDLPYRQVKQQFAAGTAKMSFTSGLFERKVNPTKDEEYAFKWASLGFYCAGSDTSLSALETFVLAMAQYPEVQRKAQAEIDRVIGTSRLPFFTDRPQLPYIEAVLREVYRWNPMGPIAEPHLVMAEDVYRDWVLPKGATVIANSWGVLHDPEIYPDPFEFKPERYNIGEPNLNGKQLWGDSLGLEQMLNPDPRKFAFGYGRRVCPGILLADDTVFMAIITILSLFDVGAVIGKPPSMTPNLLRYSFNRFSTAFSDASTLYSHPEEFSCPITPRAHTQGVLKDANLALEA
ncbi:hypothetical protein GYMLUDRAFT_164416 [Collybiopsis luxurians FD-317 M1]|uniref:Cytochrome P450 n=1 Tax=Collybiopsis luxurians FD-317 M1 TaxID=944289 RepID=A0A0D0C2Q9_9AGAR|nr:hypothetical protein GYMLUDRAFT_164416 [Collybiopsis luxurians FD-317 M1]